MVWERAEGILLAPNVALAVEICPFCSLSLCLSVVFEMFQDVSMFVEICDAVKRMLSGVIVHEGRR